MASNDVNSIEYLDLEITSSTKEAVTALNDLSDALENLIKKTGDLSSAAARIGDFGKSLNNLAKGLRDTISASKEITFGGAERSVRQLDGAVRKLANNTLNEFGIKNRKVASYYRKALSDLSNEWLANGGVSQSSGLSEKFNSKLPEIFTTYSTFRKTGEDITGVMDMVESYFGKTKHTFEYGLNDLSNEAREVFGNLLEPGNTKLGDVATTLKEIREAYGNTFFDADANTADALDQIAKKYLDAKGAAMSYWDAVNTPREKGGLGGTTARSALMNDVDAVREAVKDARNYKIGDAYNNAFNAIAEASKTLDGVDTSNMTNIINSINTVGNLDIEGITKAAKAFTQLGNSLGKITLPEGGSNIGEFIQSLYVPLKVFEDMKLPDFKPLLTLQKALSGFSGESYTIAATNLEGMVPVIKSFAEQVSGITFGGIEELGNAIKTIAKLGHANIQKSIDNMPKLAAALEKLIEQLNALPAVNDKTLRLVEALGQLKIKGVDAGKELKSASGGLNLFGKSAQKAKGHTTGLVSVFIKARAVIYALRRAFDALKGSINLASDLIEVQNVVDVTFGNYSSHLQGIAENAIESYGLSELTFKSVASQFQAMGSAMGISNTQVQDATKNLNEMGIAYGETTGAMGDMSTTLTELAADMASFYNKDIEDVQTAMTAVYTGQTRPMRQFGIDLTVATLKEWAMTQGLNSNVEAMTQAEKTMLRYQYVLAHTGAAQKDFLRTQSSWHNQTVILKEEFKALGVVIGTGLINALKPFVSAMNATMKNVIGFAENVVNALGQIFGWQMEITGGGLATDYLDDIADEAASIGDGLSGGVGDAAQSAKELKDILLGIDELNVISPDTDNSGGSSGGSGSGSGSSGATGGSGASDAVSATLKRTKAFYESDIDTLYGLGRYISMTLRDTLAGIDWDSVYAKASGFGKGLASFLNGLIRPDTFFEVGKTIAGALNTAIFSLTGFFEEFDGKEFGKSLAALINGAFDEFDSVELADALLGFAEDVWQAISTALLNVDYGLIVKGLAGFVSKLAVGVLDGIVVAIADGLGLIEDKLDLPDWLAEPISGAKEGLEGFSSYLQNTVAPEIEKTFKKSSQKIEEDSANTLSSIGKSTEKTYKENTKIVEKYRTDVGHELNVLTGMWNKNNNLKLEVAYPNITSDMQGRMNELKTYWEQNKKLPNLEVFHNDFYGQFKAKVTDLQNWFNTHRNMGKITVETPTISVHSGANAVRFNTTYVPMAYASGGYPDVGELFYAGEHGIAEIAGSVNGRTAVAGGAEITGIKKAVEAETAVLASLLTRIASLNAEIAAKDTTVNIGGRTVSKVINKHQARAGYSFT